MYNNSACKVSAFGGPSYQADRLLGVEVAGSSPATVSSVLAFLFVQTGTVGRGDGNGVPSHLARRRPGAASRRRRDRAQRRGAGTAAARRRCRDADGDTATATAAALSSPLFLLTSSSPPILSFPLRTRARAAVALRRTRRRRGPPTAAAAADHNPSSSSLSLQITTHHHPPCH